MLKYLILLLIVKNVSSQACGNNSNCNTFSAKFSIRIGKTQAACPNSFNYNKIAPPELEIIDPTGPDLVWYAQCAGTFVYMNRLRTFGKASNNTQPEKAGCDPNEDVFIWVVCPPAYPNCTIRLDYEEPMLVIRTPWRLGRVNMTSPKTFFLFSMHMGKVFEYNFRKNWGDYVNGFCKLNSSCWAGLENLKTLSQYKTKLYFEVESFYSKTAVTSYAQAFYYNFAIVGDKYQWQIKSEYYMGADPSAGGVSDAMINNNGNYFSTLDSDNDKNNTVSCASLYGDVGWWYGDCKDTNVFTNGMFNKLESLPKSFMFINFKAVNPQ